MNGMCAAFCSLLVFACLTERTIGENAAAEHDPGSGPTSGISLPGMVMEVLQSVDGQKQTKTGSSNTLCHTRDQQHFCVTALRENCTCAPRNKLCSPEGLTDDYKCPKGSSLQCFSNRRTYGQTSEISCSCSCQ
uniref:Dermacentor 9 kDa family member n=1 Tax=Rhipicephalus zambeziensis TaxID=60191 RepID=A0A224Y5Q4_9ACAR